MVTLSFSLLHRWHARRVRKQIRAGNRARDRQEWYVAAHHYDKALTINPALVAIHIQHGNMLKEAGDYKAARIAYEQALTLAPDDADAWLQLAHLLKLVGHTAEAVNAYHRALIANPLLSAAALELADLGASNRIPPLLQVGRDHLGIQAERLVQEMAGLRQDIRPLLEASRSYTTFRQLYPIAPPPTSSLAGMRFTIVVDARGRLAAEIATTLTAIRDQSHSHWEAWCMINGSLAEHPVTSSSYRDKRILFTTDIPNSPKEGATLFLNAGTVLDPQALSWFAFVRAQTECTACYADHDHADEAWHGLRMRKDPVLQPIFDPDWFTSDLSAPAVICISSSRIDWANVSPASYSERLCALAEAGESIIHIPRILSTVLNVIADVRNAPPEPQEASVIPLAFDGTIRNVPQSSTETIAVLIPTRDQADMLATCIATLVGKAAQIDKIKIVVIDNRSREDHTRQVLKDLESDNDINITYFDEPFNWSRVNNVSAETHHADIVLFINNDTEMLTDAWDDLLRAELTRPEIGIVGGCLFYPDFTRQHAGIVFGTGDGSPRHEGVGSARAEGGPSGRWLRRRSVGAVTGAAMAMRRSVWQEVGGFNEELAVGYNDVDMCLRVRARNYRVLYTPEFSLIHHESKTRGMNVNRAQVAWDRAELRLLHQNWGDALFEDPALNLQWSRQGDPFQAFEEPTLSAILAAIDRQMPARTPVSSRLDAEAH